MKILWLIPIVATTSVGLAGAFWLKGEPNRVEKRRPLVTEDRVAANGIVEGARPEVALRPEVVGNIARIYFRENQVVQAGDLLAELCNDVPKCKVDLARAELNQARASAQQSRSEFDRSQKLGPRVVSAEHAEADRSKMLQAQAKVEEAEAKLRLAQAELGKTRLTAPIRGRILRVFVEPGEQAGPTTPHPVLLLADDSKRRVRAFIEELDAHRVRVGQRAEVSYDGLPGRHFAGKVAEVLPRMGRRAPQTDAPEEYKDVYFREALIDLEAGAELALNLRVKVVIRDGSEGQK
jgi:RND family efflux transporter MFP subunit